MLVCLVLLIATLTVYCQVGRFDFINYDDTGYITGNDHVKSGLTLKGLIWLFKPPVSATGIR